MKKSILTHVVALSFALGALVYVAGNVYAELPDDPLEYDDEEDEGGGDDSGTTYCWTKITSGVLFTRVCNGYNPNVLPPNICGERILFTMPNWGAFPPPEKVQCHFP